MIRLSEPCFNGNEISYLEDCIKSGWVSGSGKYVGKLEKELATYLKTPFSVACSSGTSALHVSLKALGVEKNQEVIVPTLTFIAPVNAVKYLGADPVFMDCDDSLGLDPVKLQTFLEDECLTTSAGVINKRTGRAIKALIVVHVFGFPADIISIVKIATKYGIKVIEDSTESLGAYVFPSHGQKAYTGTLGDVGCFSFNGNKIITAGNGGMVVTSSPELEKRVRYLVSQAKDDGFYYVHDEVGYNYAMSNINAAVGFAQLQQLKNFLENKRRVFESYKKLLVDSKTFFLLDHTSYGVGNYWLIAVKSNVFGKQVFDRTMLFETFKKQNIEVRPVWKLCHTQKMYRQNQAYNIEKAYTLSSSIINIPSSVFLTIKQIEDVSSVLLKFSEQN